MIQPEFHGSNLRIDGIYPNYVVRAHRIIVHELVTAPPQVFRGKWPRLLGRFGMELERHPKVVPNAWGSKQGLDLLRLSSSLIDPRPVVM